MTIVQVSRLAQQRRYPEAARLALQVAERSLRRGFRDHAFDAFGAAGKFFQMANQNTEALAAFDHAFTIFEHDLAFLPHAGFAIGRLADWPELYTRAALAALGNGNPSRAIDLAEIGRTRVIAHRIGPDAQDRPATASVALWSEYSNVWHKAVARAAARITAGSRPQDNAERALEGQITKLRATLLAQGLEPQALTPVVKPLGCALAQGLLRKNGHRTAVLYAIRLDDRILHLISLTADGVEPVALTAETQIHILQAVDRYVQALRATGAPRWDLIQQHLPSLYQATREAMGDALTRAMKSQNIERLVWVPHGNLIDLPLAAYPCGESMLIDRIALLTAPSLTFARDALDEDHSIHEHYASVRGHYDDEERPTEGGGALLHAATDCQIAEWTSSALTDFAKAMRGRTLVVLTCHGIYDWNDPLRTFLKIGHEFHVSVATLFDTDLFGPDALIVLGACDSGTVAQGTINEAIGIPIGLIAAGARSVIGAAWPVPQIVSVGICYRFLKHLAGGQPSPEALREAICWMRDATWREYLDALTPTGHPIAAEISKLLKPAELAERIVDPVRDIARWAPYLHWGGGALLIRGAPSPCAVAGRST